MAKLILRTNSGTVLEIPRESINHISCSVQGDLKGKIGVVSVHTTMKIDNVSYFNIQFNVSPLETSRILSWYTISNVLAENKYFKELQETDYIVGEYDEDTTGEDEGDVHEQ